ncbi:LOW QUALITY PROTEIN: kinase suppressor of Ras 2-like [Leguminivora glycinivorella]|uniref:LOW QUALITY PROTEIN: kinase suppressor of Ras 2-like n=1 Tax=Leguminivora glycinivorella TaxID=1035111 RepID=UPI00200C64DA|nr:LOW QUALITY PROTEIN: kinase suppressor of Ras 2-like [Leguminivora glycinivorella]
MDIDESEIRDAIEMVETLQSMIDVAAERLEGLRTQCSTSAGLTQQEIRTLEGKLLKHFAKQLKIKERFEEILPQLNDIPCLRQWLRVVGLSEQAIQQICLRVSTLDSLRDRSDSELRGWLVSVREEEWKRLCRAMNRLRAYTDALNRGEAEAEIQLYWDSWDRNRQEWERTRLEWERSQQWRGSPRARMRQRGSVPSDPDNTPRKVGKSPRTPLNKRKENSHLPAPTNLTKSRSHESQLAVRPDEAGPDVSDTPGAEAAPSTTEAPSPRPPPPRAPSPAPRPASPPEPPHERVADYPPTPARDPSISGSLPYSVIGATPRSPRTPVGRCMAHDIAHRFAKTFNMIATCDYCDKQMLFGSGLKCKECKFKCHRDCEPKVPPSCGLPVELVHAFRDKVSFKETPFGPTPLLHLLAAGSAGSPGASRGSLLGTIQRTHRHKERRQKHPGDDLSNSSSCNSSTPSSPALVAPATPHHAHPPHHPHAPQPAPPHKPQFHFPALVAPATPHHAHPPHHPHAPQPAPPHKPQFHFPALVAPATPHHAHPPHHPHAPQPAPPHKPHSTPSSPALVAPATPHHAHPPHHPHAPQPAPPHKYSLSNSSSCNSSTPSSPALVAPATPHHAHPPHHPHAPQPAPPHKPQFHFPEVKPPVSSPNHVTPAPTPARIVDFSSEVEEIEPEEMAETNDALQDSLDANNQNQPGPWPRQNSLSLKEWDIPYDELILLDVIGKGRFGTVYRGCWHGAVAVKLLHVQALSDHAIPLDTFKHEVATFRKTLHENLVLFMGACMKPPRLAIVTSLCGGMTLHMHIHLRKDKFNPNKSLSIAQQDNTVMSLCGGMTLHMHIHLRKDKFNPNKSLSIVQQITQVNGLVIDL